MESIKKMGVANPEALHLVSKGITSPTDGKFRNPGTPEAPLVSAKDMPSATLAGSTEKLKGLMLKP